MYFAHSENARGEKHSLKDHLESTAKAVQSFAPSKDLEQLFYLTGLLHDVGKFQAGFQKYLECGKPKTPHAGIGAFIAKTFAKQHVHLQFAIQGHHAGMPDNQGRKDNNEFYGEQDQTVSELIRHFEENIQELPALDISSQPFAQKDLLLSECATRFLFSALTDADWLDTERHFSHEKSNMRVSQTLNYDVLIEALEKKFEKLPTAGKINSLRTKARNEVAARFSESSGFFSLQLPTGLGKTLTSMYWALLHARHNKLKRIIIVLPYINIIDQTALILKNIFNEDCVLEHHSGTIEDDEEYARETFDKKPGSSKQLACENWDAPIIVTTSVQFFESLFSNRPFKCRKNHNIAESVVIFDEIQTLPKEYAEPTITMLKNIAALTNTSFLFCTATQPAFSKREGFDGIESIASLISNPSIFFDATRRVEYKLLKKLKPVTLDVVQEKLSKEKESYLIIVNTKSIASDLFRRIATFGTHERCYHLSTAMCPHHRKKKIAEMIEDLEHDRRIAVISTQLVEAGVDLDFPVVYRAIAPLDAVIQAAGRCNRNGKQNKGKVVLFDLEDHRMPDATYRSCANFSKGIIQDDPETLHYADSFAQYYEQVINLFVDADKYKIREERKGFNFKTVNEQYRIINEPTQPLFVANYSKESTAYLEEARTLFERLGFIPREQHRRLQQYSVQVYPNFLKEYGAQIISHESGLRIWYSGYDDNLGLAPKDVETVF